MPKISLSTALIIAMTVFITQPAPAKDTSFTQEDRERLRNMELKLERLETTIKEFKDSVDKRLEFIQNLMIGMLAVFGGLCGLFVGLLLWDRKTFKEKAKEEAMKELEKKWRIPEWIEAFKEFAEKDERLREILKKCHLI